MATLKHAFNAKDMNSLAYRIIEGKLPQMPSKYDAQLGELIKRMLCKRPEDRPDVKHILRQPYIKQQITVFLEATKQKTAKSRKKVTNSRPHSTPNAPVHQKQEHLSSEPKARGNKSEESQSCPVKTLPNTQPPPTHDALNSTTNSTATMSNINIDIQPPDPQHKLKKAKPPRPAPGRTPAGQLASLSSRGEREESEKDDQSFPKPHPRKQVLGDHSRQDDLFSVALSRQAPSKPSDSLKPLKENKAPAADVAEEEDTMKLLQQAGMEIPAASLSAERKTENPAHQEATGDRKTEAAPREACIESHAGERRASLENTEKLLQPFVAVVETHKPESVAPLQHNKPFPHPPSSSSEPSSSGQRRQGRRTEDQPSRDRAANSRPLPPLPDDIKTRDRAAAETSETSTSSSRPAQRSDSAPQNRLLSARERRRLRQSQENQSQEAAPAVRRASCDVSSLGAKRADQPDCPRPASAAMVTHKDRKSSWRSDEEECSSSTSSTERSEGDYREGKSESNEMQDLVQMMTQTLRMDVREVSQCSTGQLPEFKLNRKYRDTLMLHGKASDGEGDFHFRSDDSAGPAKIRRAVEHLRTDVVKGLGVKLLDKVLDVMQEEDEEKREVLLCQLMGEDKYGTYAVMVRQLKFFEDFAFKD